MACSFAHADDRHHSLKRQKSSLRLATVFFKALQSPRARNSHCADELVETVTSALVAGSMTGFAAGALVSAGNPNWVRSTARAAKGRPFCGSRRSCKTLRFNSL